MAMTARLWSLSAQSVELDMDRRTVARKLARTRPDGTVQGHPAWHLQTALEALEDKPKPRREGRAPIILAMLDRIENWQEIYVEGEQPCLWSIEEAAEHFDVPAAIILDWIRAGMPYHDRGDITTGKGFVLRPANVIDWMGILTCIARATGDSNFLADIGMK